VRELMNRVPIHRNKAMGLLKNLEDSGLIGFQKESSRGRPRKIAVVTELGADFLGTFEKLQRSRLWINDKDVQRVAKQVEQVRRLEAMGVDPYQRMLEMAEVAKLLGVHQEDRRHP